MTKRLIDIDDELLSRATEILSTPSMRQTITEALELVLRVQAGRDHLATLAEGHTSELGDQTVMASAWR